MGYKPPKVTSDRPRGLATIQSNEKKTKFRVDFGDIEPVVLLADDCPSCIMAGNYYVTLSSDKTKMLNMHPADGQYIGKVKSLIAKKNQPPAPMIYKGENWSYPYFLALIELTRGKEAGMQATYFLHYQFVEAIDEDGSKVAGIGHLKSKYTPTLEEFCDVTGVWKFGPIPYQDNILPKLEKRILRNDNEFNVLFKEGWIDKIWSLQEAKVENLPEEDFGEPTAEPDPDPDDLPWEDVEVRTALIKEDNLPF
jgi:hypothetical protein